MSAADRPRPVWLTREQRDWLTSYNSRPTDEVVAAWDAAPSDATPGDRMNRLTVCFALDTDKPSGPIYDTEAEARRQPEHTHLGEAVRRLYVNDAGVIVHSEVIPDGPEE